MSLITSVLLYEDQFLGIQITNRGEVVCIVLALSPSKFRSVGMSNLA